MTGAEAPREDPTVERSAESLRDIELRDLASVHGGADRRDVWESRTYLNERNPGGPSLPLIVRVRHCSLEHAPYRLLVGHFQGLPLSGAESRLNERSDGRLERLLLMNQYPQRLGETVVLEPVDEAPPLGMVIIGLGPSGELSAAALRSAVTRALVRVALNELDRRLADRRWGRRVAVAPARHLERADRVVGRRRASRRGIGAGPDRRGDDGERSARTVAGRSREPVRSTRPTWSGSMCSSSPSATRTGWISSSACWRACNSSRTRTRQRATAPSRVSPTCWRQSPVRAPPAPTRRSTRPTRCGDGSTSAPEQGASSSVTQLEFTSIGRLARAERLLVDVERTIVDPLLAEAIDRPRRPTTSAARSTSCSSRTSSRVSWDPPRTCTCSSTRRRPTGRWNCCDPAPTRRTDGSRWRCGSACSGSSARPKRLRYNVRRASSNNALVIGNPPTPGAADLPGAAEECLAAAEVLAKHNFDVDSLIWDDGRHVRRGRVHRARRAPHRSTLCTPC